MNNMTDEEKAARARSLALAKRYFIYILNIILF